MRSWLLRCLPGILSGALVIFNVLPAYGVGQLTQVFHNSRDGFSISFPEGWTAMPAETLDSLNHAMETQRPDWKRPAIHYGYQMTNATGLTAPPYLLIRVSDQDHPPDPGSVTVEMEKEDLPQGVERGASAVNETSNVVSTYFRMHAADHPAVECRVVYFLTESSVIKLFFFMAQADRDKLSDPIEEIVRNVKISEGFQLRAPTPASGLGLVLALLAILAIVLVLFLARPAKAA